MSMDVNVTGIREHVLALVTGVFNMEQAGLHIKNVISECYQQNKRKIIVDISQLQGEIFAIQRALVGMSIAEVSSQKGGYSDEALKIAFVVGEEYLKNSEPGADHMRKAGIDALVTTDIRAAEKWI